MRLSVPRRPSSIPPLTRGLLQGQDVARLRKELFIIPNIRGCASRLPKISQLGAFGPCFFSVHAQIEAQGDDRTVAVHAPDGDEIDVAALVNSHRAIVADNLA